jgi:hypothetical protein
MNQRQFCRWASTVSAWFFVLAWTAGSIRAQQEWPQYLGGPGHAGVSLDTSIKPPLKLVWSYRLDGDASGDAGAGVTVGGGLVFVNVSNSRALLALDAHTGAFRWEYKGVLIVGCDDGHVYAFRGSSQL